MTEQKRDQFKRHIEGSVTIHGEVEARLPANVVEQTKADRREDRASEKRRFRVDILTLVGVMGATVFSGWQTSLTRNQFHLQQRPWVFTTTVACKTFDDDHVNERHGCLQASHPLDVRVAFKNTGLTPAVDVSLSAEGELIQYGNAKFSKNLRPLRESGFVAPGAELQFQQRIFESVTNEQIAMLSSKYRLAILGLGEYKDTIDPGLTHCLSYVYYLSDTGVDFGIFPDNKLNTTWEQRGTPCRGGTYEVLE